MLNTPRKNLQKLTQTLTQCNTCKVRKQALFKGIPLEDLEWTQEYRSGQYRVHARKEIYRETEPHNYVYTVFQGWVVLYKSLSNGKRQILRVALPGDLIGLQVSPNAPMEHSAQAVTDVILCGFPRNELSELFDRSKHMATRLLEMCRRDLGVMQNHLLGVGQKSAIERVAYLCLELLYRFQTVSPDTAKLTQMPLPLSQEDIGDVTGLTKIHVNRTLRALREQGLMEIHKKQLIIHNEAALIALCDFDPSVLEAPNLF